MDEYIVLKGTKIKFHDLNELHTMDNVREKTLAYDHIFGPLHLIGTARGIFATVYPTTLRQLCQNMAKQGYDVFLKEDFVYFVRPSDVLVRCVLDDDIEIFQVANY